MSTNSYVNNVWVEKYRPSQFSEIVLSPINKHFFKNIINTEYFPNLLLYGPPGTGKTTTIINLIKEYQMKTTGINKHLIIHLNASDERGIDIIRKHINTFVNSRPLFVNGLKFVILDEVDYLTKMAQIALQYLIQTVGPNVRFCLICNYISKIDEGLQTEFIRIRFNQLSSSLVIDFLEKITKSENIQISRECLMSIYSLYKSDIRSMINFIQSNESQINTSSNFDRDDVHVTNQLCIITDDVWDTLTDYIKRGVGVYTYIRNTSTVYNIDIQNITKQYLNYVIRNNIVVVSSSFLQFVENIIHSGETDMSIYIHYFLIQMKKFIS
jgi:DNA polymerase III delta prime subunit